MYVCYTEPPDILTSSWPSKVSIANISSEWKKKWLLPSHSDLGEVSDLKKQGNVRRTKILSQISPDGKGAGSQEGWMVALQRLVHLMACHPQHKAYIQGRKSDHGPHPDDSCWCPRLTRQRSHAVSSPPHHFFIAVLPCCSTRKSTMIGSWWGERPPKGVLWQQVVEVPLRSVSEIWFSRPGFAANLLCAYLSSLQNLFMFYHCLTNFFFLAAKNRLWIKLVNIDG